MLDKKTMSVLDCLEKALSEKGVTGAGRVTEGGRPADGILESAKEEGIGKLITITIGARSERWRSSGTILTGSVSAEIMNRSKIPVLVTK